MKSETKRWSPEKARTILAGVGVACCFGWAVSSTVAAAAASEISPTAETLTVPLEYQEVPYTVMNMGWTVSGQPVPFKREPVTNAAKVHRGRLNFQSTDVPPMPFLWDYAQGKLYLDLNRNEDLTDDPAGVFSSATHFFASASYRLTEFTNVHLTFPTAAGQQPWLLNLTPSEFRGRVSFSAGVRSFWSGKVGLDGREWQVGVLDDLPTRRGDASRGHLLLRPWEDRNEAFSVNDNSLSAFTFAEKLFVQTRSYAVDCKRFKQGEEPHCELTFRGQPAELGEVKLGGQFIQRLQLRDGPCLVVLDAPADTVRVPVGRYGEQLVRLGQGRMVAHLERPTFGAKSEPLTVSADKPATLVAGGPLTNSVTMTRRGGQLVLNYHLVGAGGKTYQFATTDRSKPPQFAVFQGDKKIASGKFEFG